MKKKNSYIELLRFICASLIFLYHAGINQNTWICTEFFFILSGYFLYRVSLKDVSIESEFIKKFKSVIPYTMITIVGTYILFVIVNKSGFHGLLRIFPRFLGDVLLLNSTGFVPAHLQVSDTYMIDLMPCNWLWFITSMLYCIPIILYLYKKHSNKVLWLTSFFALSLYGILVVLNGTINGFYSGIFTFIFLNVRAMAGLLLGGFSAIVSERIRENNKKTNKSNILFIVEIAMILLFVAMCFTDIPSQETLQIPLIIGIIAISLSGITKTSKIDNKILNFLGSLALPFYCFHSLIYTLMNVININLGLSVNSVRLITYIVTIILSGIALTIVKKFSK